MNKLFIVALLSVASLVSSGCTTSSNTNTNTTNNSVNNTMEVPETVTMEANKEFTLSIGQQAVFEPNGTSVEFTKVSKDSRCPAGTQCITAGEVVVEVAVNYLDNVTPYDLKLSANEEEAQANIGGDGGIGYSLELVELMPEPESGKDINSADYKATFRLIVEE